VNVKNAERKKKGYGRIMTRKEILYELSISVACLLDDLEDIKQEDIEHIQNLVTRLEMETWKEIKRGTAEALESNNPLPK